MFFENYIVKKVAEAGEARMRRAKADAMDLQKNKKKRGESMREFFVAIGDESTAYDDSRQEKRFTSFADACWWAEKWCESDQNISMVYEIYTIEDNEIRAVDGVWCFYSGKKEKAMWAAELKEEEERCDGR